MKTNTKIRYHMTELSGLEVNVQTGYFTGGEIRILCYDYQLSAFALCTVLYCLENIQVTSPTVDLIFFPHTRT